MDAAMERLLIMSLQGTLLIGGLLLLMRLLRRRLPLWLPYAAWLLPALRLLVPFSLAPRPWSPTGLVQGAVREAAAPLELVLVTVDLPAIPGPSPSIGSPADSAGIPEIPAAVHLSLLTVLFWVWIAGMGIALAYTLWINLRFARGAKHRERLEIPGCPLPVYRCENAPSPCLYGLFRPCILLNGPACAGEDIRAMAIAHELAHFERRDHLTALLRGLCCIVHWFNPAVWYAAARARQDCELACDERVMRRLGEADCRRYGLALIDLVSPHGARQSLLAGGTPMTGGKDRLKERIAFIGTRPSVRKWALVCAACAAALLCFLSCAEAPSSMGIIGGADGPTAIFVTGDGKKAQREPYTPVLAPMEGEGRPSFASVMEEELPYIALGTEIRLGGEDLTVTDYLLWDDGRVRYSDGAGGPLGQEIALEQDEEGLYFLLPGNMATALSSDSADYAPGAAIRGFLVTDGEGNTQGFVLRTDPSFLIAESDAGSAGIIGGADGPTSIHIAGGRDGEILSEGDVIAVTGGADRPGIVLVAGAESREMIAGTEIPENAHIAGLPVVTVASRAKVSAASAAAVAERLRADLGAEAFDRAAAEGIPVGIYACVPYGSGELILADFYRGGESAPDLFYVENGAAAARTYGADYWSVNYARIGESTIAFGPSFAWDEEAGDLPTTHAEATFTEGGKAECAMGPGAGFILIGAGDVRSVSLYDGNTLVMKDDWYPQRDGLWAGTDLEFRERLHFCSLYDRDAAAMWPTVAVTDAAGREYRMRRYAVNDGFTFPDLWRNNNWMIGMAHAAPDTPVTIAYGSLIGAAPAAEATPAPAPAAEAAAPGPDPTPAAAAAAFRAAPDIRQRQARIPRLRMAEPRPTPTPAAAERKAYWVNPALDDGTEAGAARAVTAAEPGALRTPQSPGFHILVLDNGSGYLYTLPVLV